MDKHSDYIVYVDESGNHELEKIEADYPVFVLAFCIFKKDAYASSITPNIQRFKFKHFGHDMVVLHEHEIRKAQGNFDILTKRIVREEFLNDLSGLIKSSLFTIVSVVIEKNNLKLKYKHPENPYHIALEFGLERVFNFLENQNQQDRTTHIVFEKRGKKEDAELELEFRRVLDKNTSWGIKPFEIIMADKKVNSCGLQLADLVARPIGRKILKPSQNNRAFDIIENKFYHNSGKAEGWGLKFFP